jgi:RNA polymerase sigma factor (TIGR02999 family)
LEQNEMVFPQQGVTQLLVAWGEGDKAALDELMPVVYDELRRLAQRYLSRERPGHTLQTTALVHEAYLRLVDQRSVNWQNRAQFFGIAAQMMRRILINHAKDRHAKKRQGYAARVSLDDAVSFFEQRELDLVALDEALNGLALLDPQQTQIVELRFFGGLTIEEVAEVLGLSPATIKREWDSAKLWLRRQLSSTR